MLNKLRKVKVVNSRPNPKANYYVYITFASWAETASVNCDIASIVSMHESMKKDGRCDMIYVGLDFSLGDMKNFLKEHKAKFAAVWIEDKHIKNLAGYKPRRTCQEVTVVDRTGKVRMRGTIRKLSKWKSEVDKLEAADRGETPDVTQNAFIFPYIGDEDDSSDAE